VNIFCVVYIVAIQRTQYTLNTQELYDPVRQQPTSKNESNLFTKKNMQIMHTVIFITCVHCRNWVSATWASTPL